MKRSRKHQGKVGGETPSPINLMAVIREIATSSENIFFANHAYERLMLRGFNDKDVIDGLKIGDIDGPVTPGENNKEWVCKVVFPEPDVNGRRSIGAITIVLDEQEIFIKTVMWITR